jgi:hypothetical protein
MIIYNNYLNKKYILMIYHKILILFMISHIKKIIYHNIIKNLKHLLKNKL